MSILIFLPVANYSGSAVALLRVAKILIGMGWHIDVFSVQGPILQDFKNIGANLYGKLPEKKYSYVIFNSIVSIDFASKIWDLVRADKKVLWLHEDENFLKLIKIELVKYKNLNFDNIIYPIEYLINFAKVFTSSNWTHFNNVVDVPYSLERGDDFLCVVGAYESRKNQDFILNNYNAPFGLKFIGKNVSRIKTNKKSILIEELSESECTAQVGRSLGVISASLMETQNLVALEAIQAGKPVLLSKIDAHVVLSKRFSNVLLFDFNDLNDFELKINRLIVYSNDKEKCFSNAELAKALYGEKRAKNELLSIFKHE